MTTLFLLLWLGPPAVLSLGISIGTIAYLWEKKHE